MRSIAVPAAALMLVACSIGGAESPSPAASSPRLAGPSGQLGAQVAMPPGFPTDVPIYPKARLTAAAAFPNNAPTAWGMEWQTLDSVSKVQAYYADQMNKTDWTINFTSNTPERFTAKFMRRSDNRVGGTLESNSASGVTKILMSLVSPAA